MSDNSFQSFYEELKLLVEKFEKKQLQIKIESDLDYEKHYYDDHYIMIVCTYYFGSAEKQIFYVPEHLFLIHSRLRGTSTDDNPVWPTQPQYAFDELEDIDEWARNDKIAHHLAMKG